MPVLPPNYVLSLGNLFFFCGLVTLVHLPINNAGWIKENAFVGWASLYCQLITL
jgi:hypothetical protein